MFSVQDSCPHRHRHHLRHRHHQHNDHLSALFATSVGETIEERHEVFRKYWVTNHSSLTACKIQITIFLSSMLLFHGKSRDICLWSSQFSATSSEFWLLWKPVSNLNKNCTDWICRIDQKFMAQGHRPSAVSWSRWEKGRTANHNQVWYKDGTTRLQQFQWLKVKARKRRHVWF